MRALLFAAALIVSTDPAFAQVPMVGAFVAEATCAATPSIRNPDRNPGDVSTEAGHTYDLVGRNAVPGSHYLILVPGAEPERRWVAYGCGRVEDGGAQAAQAPAPRPGRSSATSPTTSPAGPVPVEDDFLLAASWQPAFCETRPRVSECREGARDDRGFSLHGLWPQPRGRDYCNVEPPLVALDERGDWDRLPAPELTPATAEGLARIMPGVASGLDRHQWIKHGSCFPGDAEAYFAASVRLIEDLNDSAVRGLFEDAVGETLDAETIRAAFDEAFGRGAGARVLVDCVEADGRRLIRELRIELSGSPQASLADLVLAAETVPAGCRRGEVDEAGFEDAG